MTKDNLVFGLAGVVVGIIAGVFLANYSAAPRQAPPAVPQTSANPQQPPTVSSRSELPEGHPPVDQTSLKQQIAQQEDILKGDPDNQQATVALGNLNFDMKNYQEAAGWYEKALKRDPKK